MLLRFRNLRILTQKDYRYASSIVNNLQGKTTTEELSYFYQPGVTPIEDTTISQLIERASKQWPKREWIHSIKQGVRLTYSDLLERADKLAAGLRKIGLNPGDRIGIWSPNNYEWILSYAAASRAGLLIVGINHQYVDNEIQYSIQKVGMKAIFALESFRDQKYAKMLLKAKAFCPSLEHIIIYDDDHVTGTRRFRDIETLANKKEIEVIAQEQALISPYSGTNIQFTSGTTGKPKAVLLSHRSLFNNSKQVITKLNISGRKICLNVPCFHAFGMIIGVLSPMHAGLTVIIEGPTFNPTTSINTIIQEKCYATFGTPTMWINMIDVQNKTGAKIDSLQSGLVGGSLAYPSLFKKIKKYLGIEQLTVIYGLTETTACVTQSLPNESKEFLENTVGHVGEHLEVKVIDENGDMVPFDTPGELCTRGYSTMIKYWDDEKSTKETITDDNWLKTGDQFILYKNGYGSVVGRLKDMLIRGGENIFPKEIEFFYENHPEIAEVHAFGVFDEIYGEEICACIRLKENSKLTTEDVVNYAKGKIARYKIPRYIHFCNNFPKTASGKIQKFKLREELEEKNIVPKYPKI